MCNLEVNVIPAYVHTHKNNKIDADFKIYYFSRSVFPEPNINMVKQTVCNIRIKSTLIWLPEFITNLNFPCQ